MLKTFQKNPAYLLLAIVLVLSLSVLACDLGAVGGGNGGGDSAGSDPLLETNVALAVELTKVADAAMQLTDVAQDPPDQNPPDQDPNPQPTQAAPTEVPPTQAPPPPPTTEPEPQVMGFSDWIEEEARILLYEDLYGTYLDGWIRYALKGLNYDYDNTNADIGILEQQLDTGIEWDLIIYAREDRTYLEGHITGKLYDRLRDGSSVIIEMWNLDEDYDDYSSISNMFRQCGITFQRDFKPANQDEQVLYAHNSDNPIHSQPNDNIRMNYVLDTWKWDANSNPGDYGDLLQLIPGGDAEIILGHNSVNDEVSGTVVACFDNRLIIQTHGTHSYGDNRSIPLWENYIYNALRARYEYLYGD